MSPELVRWAVAAVLFAHGVGHVLFIPLLAPALRLDASGASWLLDPVLGSGTTKLLATLVGGAALAAFVAAAAGVAIQASWWRPLAVAAAVASAGLIVALWGGLQGSSAFAALAFDLLVLVALLVARWPAEALAS
jgi:hypothetical protein